MGAQSKHADVAVVGAGPAGAWAAYRLARGGADVRIYDPSHPREKPCGGGVTGRALRLVREAVAVDKLPAVSIRRARFLDTTASQSATVPLERAPERALIVASRAVFDRQLLAAACQAGAQLIKARVADVQVDGEATRLRLANGQLERASVVIGADGATSLVRRRLAHGFHKHQLTVATGFFAYGCSSDEIAIELTSDPPGYIWSFPRPDHLAIGICADVVGGAPSSALRTRVAEWMRATGLGAGTRLEPYAWPIPSLSSRDLQSLRPSGPRWMLVGDAAGLVDPITREGISFAMLSADYAATALLSASDRPEVDYLASLRDEIVPELLRAARLKARFFHPAFRSLLMSALTQKASIRAVMSDLIAGTQPYRGLRWRLAKTGEIALLWQWVAGRPA